MLPEGATPKLKIKCAPPHSPRSEPSRSAVVPRLKVDKRLLENALLPLERKQLGAQLSIHVSYKQLIFFTELK